MEMRVAPLLIKYMEGTEREYTLKNHLNLCNFLNLRIQSKDLFLQ